jgi:hypothetical protein
MIVTVMVSFAFNAHAGDMQRRAGTSMMKRAVGMRLARFELDAKHLPADHPEHGLGEQQQHGGELDGPRSHRRRESLAAR